MHDTLIAVSSRTRQSFKSLQDEGKLHCRVRAADVRHLLLLNCSTEPSEITHKIWVKGQGDNTNQGASSAKTMMRHSQSKAAAQECAHAIAGICSKGHVLQS